MAARIKRDQDQEKRHKQQVRNIKRMNIVRYTTARLGFPGRSYEKLKSRSVKTGG